MSDGEAAFLHFWHILLPDMPTPEREYRFDYDRNWRLDFAWPAAQVAVEIESSVHRIKSRFHADIPKYNQATYRGWQVFRITRQMLEDDPKAFLALVGAAIKARTKRRDLFVSAEEGE